ncbi:hypothetical protein HGRIS_003962 [Hohenbuehelia grisea]|uniref:F-box domain-containing protein n=1 Tax=Hohenbuehelia grisea TaxID=104357 RepID=A0ABR3JHE3_9AGAR
MDLEPRQPPNFTSTYSVVLDHPLEIVFGIIGTEDGAERVTRLSKLCTDFKLLQRDEVSIPEGRALADSHVRGLPSAPSTTQGDIPLSEPTRALPRRFFELQETVPILFGAFKQNVHLHGTLTWDTAARTALYETHSDAMGIDVWKLRMFEEVVEPASHDGHAGGGGEGNTKASDLPKKRTRVTERIEGNCPSWVRLIVQQQTTKGHRLHMETYHTLF